MAEAPRIAVAVLAAGQSRRFAAGDKLATDLQGMPLGLHVCTKLGGVDFAFRWVITSRIDHPCANGWRARGFEIALNPNAHSGMGSSVALAAKLAIDQGADALLIALADMPLVPVHHFESLVKQASEIGSKAVVASASGRVQMPPAVFGGDQLKQLLTLSGSAGARHLLDRASLVPCSAELLIDIDDEDGLARANAVQIDPD